VKLDRENPTIANANTNQVLGPGDFFGVISCMSGHSRIETAIALTQVALISVKREQFGILIQKNPTVAMKIIRFFSRQLRIFDEAITRLTLKDTVEEDPSRLYNIAQYYLSKKRFKNAAYTLQRYIQWCPDGTNKEQAIKYLQDLKAPLKLPENTTDQGLTRSYKDQSIIFSENEPGDELYIIQTGQVKITKVIEEEVLLAVLKSGDIFGEMAILENRPRNASATAFGETNLMAINKLNFQKMVQAQPQLATRLIQLLSERIWTAYRQLENLTIKNSTERIYETLLIQLEKQKIKIRPKVSHNFQFGTKELLNMIGLQEDESDNLIVELFDDRLLTLEGGKLVCLDIAELEKTAHFYRKKSSMERKREENKKAT
jgi:CRP/FNR family transcriptional regulator